MVVFLQYFLGPPLSAVTVELYDRDVALPLRMNILFDENKVMDRPRIDLLEESENDIYKRRRWRRGDLI